MPASFELVKFDPGEDSHARFVYDSFRRGINVWPWSHVPVEVLMNRLKRELATPGTDTKIALAFNESKSFIGWYAVRKNEDTIVYGYTDYRQRRQGIAGIALSTMGLDLDGALYVRFYTPACARLAARGRFHLIFDTRDAYDS